MSSHKAGDGKTKDSGPGRCGERSPSVMHDPESIRLIRQRCVIERTAVASNGLCKTSLAPIRTAASTSKSIGASGITTTCVACRSRSALTVASSNIASFPGQPSRIISGRLNLKQRSACSKSPVASTSQPSRPKNRISAMRVSRFSSNISAVLMLARD